MGFWVIEQKGKWCVFLGFGSKTLSCVYLFSAWVNAQRTKFAPSTTASFLLFSASFGHFDLLKQKIRDRTENIYDQQFSMLACDSQLVQSLLLALSCFLTRFLARIFNCDPCWRKTVPQHGVASTVFCVAYCVFRVMCHLTRWHSLHLYCGGHF